MSQAGKESGRGKREKRKDIEKMRAVYIWWGWGGWLWRGDPWLTLLAIGVWGKPVVLADVYL